MHTRAAQIAVHEKGLLTSVGVGDGQVSGDRRLSFARGGTRDNNRTQPSFKVRKKNCITYRPHRFLKIRCRATVSLPASICSFFGHNGSRWDGRKTLRKLSRKAINRHRPNHICAEELTGFFRVSKRRIEGIVQKRSACRQQG